MQRWSTLNGSTMIEAFNENVEKSRYYNATHHWGNLFEVAFSKNKPVVAVDLSNHTCNCRTWKLIGIPFEHAVKRVLFQNEDPLD